MSSYSDDFNRASLGSDWTEWINTGAYSVSANTLLADGSASWQAHCLNYDTAMAGVNHEAEITISTMPNSGGWTGGGIYINGDGGTDQTFLYLTASPTDGHVKLAIFEAGSNTNIDTYSYTPASGDVLKLKRDGSSITCYVNGTSRITHTLTSGQQTSLSGHAHGGVYYYSGQYHHAMGFDDFSISDIGSGGSALPAAIQQYRRRRN